MSVMTEYMPSQLSPTSPTPSQNNGECVDYLSFQFNTLDIMQCWKYNTKFKHSITNGRRLENASWRKFFQLHNKCQKTDPAKLGWKKDNDVVWLYGPFHALYEPITSLEAKYQEELLNQQSRTSSTITASESLKSIIKKPVEHDDFLQALRIIHLQSLKDKTSTPSSFIIELAKNRRRHQQTSNHSISEEYDNDPLTQALLPQDINYSSLDDSTPIPKHYIPRTRSLPELSSIKGIENGKSRHKFIDTRLVDNLKLPNLNNINIISSSKKKGIRFNQTVQQRLIIELASSVSSQSSSFSSSPSSPRVGKPPYNQIFKKKKMMYNEDDEIVDVIDLHVVPKQHKTLLKELPATELKNDVPSPERKRASFCEGEEEEGEKEDEEEEEDEGVLGKVYDVVLNAKDLVGWGFECLKKGKWF